MVRTNTISGIKALVYIRLMEGKNNIKLIFTHPVRAISALLKIILPIIIAWIPFMLNSKNVKKDLPTVSLPINMIGTGIMLLIIVIFFINLYKAVENYYPTQYSAADVNFLFTSPISSRLIYAWSITKQIFNSLLGSIFMIIPMAFVLRAFNILVSDRGIIYAFIGSTLFIIVVQTLNFFLYSIAKRFNVVVLIETLVFASIAGVMVYLVTSIYGSTNVLERALEVIGGRSFDRIPFIGWVKHLIMSPFIDSAPVIEVFMLLLFVAVMMFFTVYFATDYYEEAIVSTEKRSKILDAANKNNMEEIQELNSKKKTKVKLVEVDWNFKKAYAFLWKAAVINKRKSKGIIAELLKYVVFAAIGGVFSFVFRKQEYKEVLLFIIVFSTTFTKSNFALMEGLEYELKKNYLFLLPGRVRDKILAINTIPIIKTLVRNFVVILPMIFFLKVNIIQLLSLWVVMSSTNLINLFTIVAIKVIMPFEDNKNMILVYLRYIIEILMELPAVGLGILTWFLFKNIEGAVFVFGLSSLISVVGLLYISEALFHRLELNN
jgi:hypothetical protein